MKRSLCLVAALAAFAAAHADQGTVVRTASLPYNGLNWNDNLVLPKFDASLGNLDSVEISFHAAAKGTVQLENLDDEPNDYIAQVSYNMRLQSPAGADLLTVEPAGEYDSGSLDAFDDVIDYAGPSGVSYPETSADASKTLTLTGSDAQAFVGTGNVSFPVIAASDTLVATPGNFKSKILSYAAADVTVTYHYSFTPAPVLGSLGDRVWFDANGNGRQDDGEHGMPGLTVQLLDANGAVLKTTATDAQGTYLFDGLAAGDYRVQFSKPAGYGYTVADAAVATDDLDSDADGGGLSPLVHLNAGQNRTDVDAGLVGTLCVGDRVWFDTNGNGLQDSCEPGAKNVPVHLLDQNGNVLADTTTDANGAYKFSNLAPGAYTVDFDAPAGYGFTKPFADSRYKQYDSNADPLTGNASVVLTANDATIDAGLVGALKIGDTVWLDSDGDGKYEPEVGELGIPGVSVILVGDTNGDGWPDYYATTKTDKDGHYLFLGLKPGNYAVTVNGFDLPRNVVPSYDLDGVNSRNFAIGRLTNADRLDFDFGYKPGSNCSGGSHCWWNCNPSRWSCDHLWVGGKCHSKTTICSWFKKADCGDKSICFYQRLCAAKLNVGDGCNEGTVFTCGKTTCTIADAIKRADDWMSKHPVGCGVSASSADWAGACDVFGILDRFCSGR